MAQETGSLRGKYQSLIDAANTAGVSDLKVRQEENVLYIDGNAPSAEVKDQLWRVYNTIDPDYRAGDLVMNIQAPEAASGNAGEQEYVVVKGDSLSKIGERYGIPWKEIYEANKDQIRNPDLIQPGWKLKIPSGK